MSNPLKKHKRWTAKRKFEAVLELIKNHKTLDELSRETGQPAHILSQWREDFLSKGESLFKEAETSKEKALDEQLLWVRNFQTVDQLLEALHEFKQRYNQHWIMQRHGYLTPKQVPDEWNAAMIEAA